ncbi:MAG TPA: hypothetical protein VFQ61_03160 [Polyangiaceae bacterium]|nr:hypothetical protein [Polyangiaceae bacterium]
MNSKDDDIEARDAESAAAPRRTWLDTVLWVVLPMALVVALAVRFWPR